MPFKSPLERTMLALFLLLLVPSSAGVIRFYLDTDFEMSLVLGAIAVLVFVLFIGLVGKFRDSETHPDSRKFSQHEEFSFWVILVALLCGGAFLYLRLSAPSFEQLPVIGTEGGGDSGNHVMLSENFRFKSPQEYQGQNLFYVLIGSFKGESSRNFHSAFWHSTIALWFLSFSFVILSWYAIVQKSKSFWKFIITGGIGLAISFAFSDRLILPYYHYFQIDGFYSSIAGVAVFSSAIAAYTLLSFSWHRIFVLLVSVVLLRHAYALNVGEFLVACSVALWFECLAIKGVKGNLLKALAVLIFLAAGFVYKNLFPLLSIGGGFTKWRSHNALPLEIFFVAAAFLEFWLVKQAKQANDFAYQRFLVFTGSFVGVGLLIQLAIYTFKLPQMYYFYKHAMPLFLLSGIGLIGILLRRLSFLISDVDVPALNLKGRLALFSLLGAFFAAWTTSRIYNVTYDVRRQDCSSGCFELSPLHFPNIQQEIESVLELKQKKFGGILHTHWPFFNFLTASLGRHVALWNEQPTYFSGSLAREEGYCVFWSETQREKERMLAFTRDTTFTEEKKNRLVIYNSLVSSPIKECGQETGSGYWRNTLCWECR